MRVLVSGRGSIAQRHVRHLRLLRPDATVAVLSGGEPAAVMAPFEWFTNWKAASAWRPDALVIASVSSAHAQDLVTGIRAGLPCLAEKPLVASRSDLVAVRVAVAARDPVAPVVVGCNLRYLPSLRAVFETVRDGVLGRILRASFEAGQDLRQWRPERSLKTSYSAKSELGGGVLLDLVHEVDLARWLLGPLQVRAAIGGQFSRALREKGVNSHDVHIGLLELPWGAPVTVTLDYVSSRLVRRFALVGELATLHWDLVAQRCWIDGTQTSVDLSNRTADFDVAETYRSQMSDWLQSIADPAHLVVSSLKDALMTSALMLEMKEAAN